MQFDFDNLSQSIIEKIKSDAILYGIVAAAVKVAPTSLQRLLNANDPVLTQKRVLVELSKYLNVEENGLFNKIPSKTTV